MIFVPFLLKSTSLKKAPYVSWFFFLTVVPNLSSSSGTGWLAPRKMLTSLGESQYDGGSGIRQGNGTYEPEWDLSCSVKRVMALPVLPARPVRPMR